MVKFWGLVLFSVTYFGLAQALGAQDLRVRGPAAQFFCESHAPVTPTGPAGVNLVLKVKVRPEVAEKLLRGCLEASIPFNSDQEIIGFAWFNPLWADGEEKIIRLSKDHDALVYKPKEKKIVKIDSVREIEKAMKKKSQ